MRHTGFFNGIGGFMLAAEWMGWENVDSIEIDPWCNKIIEKNFPGVNRYYDIKEYKGKPGDADIFTGGFPCQPFSHAGKRRGTDDHRNLWPEYFRIICESKPTFVVGENVAGLTTMENVTPFEKWLFLGMESKSNLRRIYSRHLYRKRQTFVLNGIINDLEGEGYTVESFIIPACSVGAWHRRDRIWIIGYLPERLNRNRPCANSNGIKRSANKGESNTKANRGDNSTRICEDVPNTKRRGQQGSGKHEQSSSAGS